MWPQQPRRAWAPRLPRQRWPAAGLSEPQFPCLCGGAEASPPHGDWRGTGSGQGAFLVEAGSRAGVPRQHRAGCRPLPPSPQTSSCWKLCRPGGAVTGVFGVWPFGVWPFAAPSRASASPRVHGSPIPTAPRDAAALHCGRTRLFAAPPAPHRRPSPPWGCAHPALLPGPAAGEVGAAGMGRAGRAGRPHRSGPAKVGTWVPAREGDGQEVEGGGAHWVLGPCFPIPGDFRAAPPRPPSERPKPVLAARWRTERPRQGTFSA